MSKIAILSDVHSNLPALRAVLAEVGQCGADRLVFGGDHRRELLGLAREAESCRNS